MCCCKTCVHSSPMKIFHSVAFRGKQDEDPSLSLLKVYFPELEMHTMQLYLVVEEAAGEGMHIVSNRRLEPVTTRCEFTLVQALENILGGDLTHYEIVGPGSWVTWSTFARDLKGQQLTLRYHNRPVPHTQLALYGPRSQTELKVLITLSHNILPDVDLSHSGETYVKEVVSDPTKMENLKYASMKSSPSSKSDSNNERDCNSLETEKKLALAESVIPGGPSTTFSELTLDTRDCQFTLDSQTPVKIPVCKENTKDSCYVNKVLPDKVLYERDSKTPDDNEMVSQQPQNPLDVLNNVPCLSILHEGFPSDQPRSSQQTQCKSLSPMCEVKQNNLNCVSHCTGNHTSCLPKEDQNVPFLSFPSSVEAKPKSPAMLAVYPTTQVHPVMQDETSMDSSLDIETVSINSTSSAAMPHSGQGGAASSLFTQGKNTQEINVSMCQGATEYVPLKCIQTIGDNQTLTVPQVVDRIPSPLGSVRTPPSKRHRMNDVTTSLAQQQLQLSHQIEQQALLQRQSLEQKRLHHQEQVLQQMQQQQQLHQQQQLPYKFDVPENSQGQDKNVSTVEFQIHRGQLLPQHQQQQQQQQQFAMNTNTAGAQPGHSYISRPTLPSRQGQSWSNPPREPTALSQLTFHSDPQGTTSPQQQHQQQPPLPYKQQPTTQHSLMCHTPTPLSLEPPHHIRSTSEPLQIAMPQDVAGCGLIQPSPQQSHLSQPTYQNIPSTHSPQEKIPSPQYVDMTRHPSSGNVQLAYLHSQMASPRTGTEPEIPLPSVEFTVRLPNANSNPQEPGLIVQYPPVPRIQSQTSNHSSSTSRAGSSQRSSNAGSHRGSLPEAVIATGNIASSRTVPVPFAPVPPSVDVFGGRLGSSWNNNTAANVSIPQSNSQGEFRGQPDSPTNFEEEERYNYIDSNQVNRSVSLPANHWSSPGSTAERVNIEDELSRLEGWCPTENGDSIQTTMARYRSQDGSFIIWKSRRHNKFVITVSHLSELIYLLVEEEASERGTVYYLFRQGFHSHSLLDLVHHYRQMGIQMPLRAAAGSKRYHEHIRLRYPLRVRLEKKKRGK